MRNAIRYSTSSRNESPGNCDYNGQQPQHPDLSHRRSPILDRVEVGNYFADDLAYSILTALALAYLVKFLSPNRHLMTAMRSG